ncbi:MAG TPA: TRAP transporter small permease [Burkholderiales bacterium]
MIESARRATRAVNRAFLALAGVLALGIFAAMLYDLVMRNAFDAPTLWALDVSRFMLLYLFFLALAPALEAGSHVSVDVLADRMPPVATRWLRCAALVLTIVFGAILLWQLSRATRDAFARDEVFPIAVPIPVKYVYWIGPLGTLQFLLTAVVELVSLWIPSSASRSS